MNTIHLGEKIRELRKKKNITQEVLAEAMSVSPQAVSKWESNTSYPDMPLIPMLAGYFEVSLDTLFDYDMHALNEKIDGIISEAKGEDWNVFWEEPKKYQSIIRSALLDHPDNEKLMSALLESYEYDHRTNGETGYLDEMLVLTQKLMDESGDFEVVNNCIETKAAVLLAKGQYEEAKVLLEALPVPLKYDSMAFRLSGKDKYNAAAFSWCSHLESLYIADMLQADAIFELDPSHSLHGEYGLARYFYKRGAETIELYIRDYEGGSSYVWDGMQTFHYMFYLGIARCCKKLGEEEECRKAVDTAYSIISTSWPDFSETPACYLKNYNKTLEQYDLHEYKVVL